MPTFCKCLPESHFWHAVHISGLSLESSCELLSCCAQHNSSKGTRLLKNPRAQKLKQLLFHQTSTNVGTSSRQQCYALSQRRNFMTKAVRRSDSTSSRLQGLRARASGIKTWPVSSLDHAWWCRCFNGILHMQNNTQKESICPPTNVWHQLPTYVCVCAICHILTLVRFEEMFHLSSQIPADQVT